MNNARGPPPPQVNPLADAFLRMQYDLQGSPVYNSDTALKALVRLPEFSARYPYGYHFIDRPHEGDTHIIFLPNGNIRLPNDGVRYLEEPQRMSLQGGGQLEMEIWETRSGFVPGLDQSATRVRRLFRLIKGGHPNMAILHYSRGQPAPIPPQIINAPIRSYPLPPINEPAIYVFGEKAGQKVMLQPAPGQPGAPQLPPGQQQQQQPLPPGVQQGGRGVQARNLAAHVAGLERADRGGGRAEVLPPPQYPNEDDDDSFVTNRSLALLRFTRNHDNLADIFSPVSITQIPKVPSPYEGMNVSVLEAELARLNDDIAILQQKKSARAEARERAKASTSVDLGTGTGEVAMDIS